MRIGFIIILIILAYSGCKKNNSGEDQPNSTNGQTGDIGTCTSDQLLNIESDIISTLSTVTTEVDFSFKVSSEDGRSLNYSRGASTFATSYESASTSKWISSAIILSYIESVQNLNSSKPLTLDSKVTDFLDSTIWPISSSDGLYNIKLRHLLSFTSGLNDDPICLTSGVLNLFSSCVTDIATSNIGKNRTPGNEFSYGSSHLQVAGLMAIKARDIAYSVSNSSWQILFTDFKNKTGLFSHSAYDLPSSLSPRLAGGMHWIGDDYFAFVKAYYLSQIYSGVAVLGQTLNQKQLQMYDQVLGATVVYSPIQSAVNENWHYGFGMWLECYSTSYNCTEPEAYSSPGAYGAYPFFSTKSKYYGLIARQGALGTFRNGLDIFRTVKSKIDQWSKKNCP